MIYHVYFSIMCVLLLVLPGVSGQAQQISGLKTNIVTNEAVSNDDFPIVCNTQQVSPIRFDTNDHKGVIRAIGDLQADIERVTSLRPKLVNDEPLAEYEIIIGTLGHCKLLDQLVKSKKLDLNDLKGKWERFVIATIDNPIPNSKKCVVIAGSDKRGTIYGIYELSQQLGVSPWYWWADVPVKQRSSAYVKSGRHLSDEPKVKYRGIFINDENPCMQRWAREKFGGMNSQMYAHVFELILRLRGNCLWPAMWGSFLEHKPMIPILKDENGVYHGNSFNEDDPGNPRLADEYGIVMGTSHHEPMQRSQQEWIRNKHIYGNGQWNYVTNKDGIQQFFRDGIANAKNYECLVTMGMRGDEDRPMEDAGSAEANFRVLEGIMADQRNIIDEVAGKSASNFQQVWTLYSEVLDYFDQGMHVPDDMIIVLCDNNWGDVRRLPELGGKKHPGGYGMYYHAGYYGGPRASKWLNITQISQMWEQMHLTYQYGVDKVWILNVGALKPNEYAMDFFLNMAWNPDAFNEKNLDRYAQLFCGQQFGDVYAMEAARIIDAYCKYISRIFPELLDHRTYNLVSGEFKMVKNEFMELEARALRLFIDLPAHYRDTYKQLVLYPVQAMANLYDMYYAVAMNQKLAAEKDIKANFWADHVVDCFRRDSILSANYNHQMANGKWNHMMDQVHFGYTAWHGPEFNIMPNVERLLPDDAICGGYVFRENKGVVVIEAEHYYRTNQGNHASWTVIPDMGRTLSGITLMPYTEKTDGSSILYKMNITPPSDSIKVWLFFDSTMPFKKGGHQVAASFDGGAEKIWNINSELTWKNVYNKMYPTGAARMIETYAMLELPQSTADTQVLKIRLLDPGMVLYKIVVDNGGYEHTFLKMDESPSTRIIE
jgi:hypothetical protein